MSIVYPKIINYQYQNPRYYISNYVKGIGNNPTIFTNNKTYVEKKGTKLICICPETGEWVTIDHRIIDGPKRFDIVTCNGFDNYGVLLVEYPFSGEGYNPTNFKPLKTDFRSISYTKVVEKESELILEN